MSPAVEKLEIWQRLEHLTGEGSTGCFDFRQRATVALWRVACYASTGNENSFAIRGTKAIYWLDVDTSAPMHRTAGKVIPCTLYTMRRTQRHVLATFAIGPTGQCPDMPAALWALLNGKARYVPLPTDNVPGTFGNV